MKIYSLLSLLLLLAVGASAQGARKTCDCKCVVKDEDGKFTTIEASGATRTEAGDKLKAKLKKQKCELSPVCEGACSLDK
jgi:uncharacterized protein YcfL